MANKAYPAPVRAIEGRFGFIPHFSGGLRDKFNPGGAYVNFMMDDEIDGRLQATYGANYQKLATVKKKYDPKNIFRVNQNIRPAA